MTAGASIADLRAALCASGARPRHETLILRAWVRGLPLDAFAQSEDSQLPLALRGALPELTQRFAALVGVRLRASRRRRLAALPAGAR